MNDVPATSRRGSRGMGLSILTVIGGLAGLFMVLSAMSCSVTKTETMWGGSGRAGGMVQRDTVVITIGTATIGSGGSGTTGRGIDFRQSRSR